MPDIMGETDRIGRWGGSEEAPPDNPSHGPFLRTIYARRLSSYTFLTVPDGRSC